MVWAKIQHANPSGEQPYGTICWRVTYVMRLGLRKAILWFIVLRSAVDSSKFQKDIRCIREKEAWHYAMTNDFEPEAA